jgi:hypothetical protein
MGKLSIITNTSVENKLTINNNKEIYYITNDGTVNIIEGDLRYRPLHCSELSNKFELRGVRPYDLFISGVEGEDDYNNPIIKFSYIEPRGEMDEIDTTDTDNSFPLCGDLDRETKDLIDKKYIELFGDGLKANEELRFLSSTNNISDKEIIESMDLIKSFDSYTNTVDLNELINYSTDAYINCRVDLTILYSINGVIYNYNTMFTAFDYNAHQVLNMYNTIETINNRIQLEYINGTIKVIPTSQEVNECIINNCTAIYGKLK